MPAPDFSAAAVRHFRDARLLETSGRLPNADHLSGFAAECALKALVALHLGGKVINDYAHWDAGGKKSARIKDHLGGKLWTEVAALASRRGAPNEVITLLVNDPFSDWDVSERYTPGDRITSDVVRSHLAGAEKALSALESFRLTNMTGGTS